MAVRFELSSDPALLSQYYRIRERCFRRELVLPEFDGSAECYDVPGQILIIREGDRCLGGARFNGYDDPQGLPLESDGFDLLHSCQDLMQPHERICQWSRLAIAPEYRQRIDGLAFCRTLVTVGRDLGYHYAFYVTGHTRARLFRQLYVKLGFSFDVLNHVELPVEPGFENLPHLLTMLHLNPLAASHNPSLAARVA